VNRSELQNVLDGLSASIDGKVAYAFDRPASETRLERRARDPFISASVIKVPILAYACRLVSTGQASWDETFAVKSEDKVGGSGVLNVMRDGLPVTLRDLCVLMTVVSDNTATNMVLERVGPANVNAWLRENGWEVTTCVRKLYDWDAINKGIHNIICAAELTDLLKRAAQGGLNGPETDADMLAIMRKQQYREKIPHLLPRKVEVAHKTGTLDEVAHDCGVVYLPGGDWFVLSLFTGDLKPPACDGDRDALYNTMARMSLACYEYALGT
jgi:beta-lactamase class A